MLHDDALSMGCIESEGEEMYQEWLAEQRAAAREGATNQLDDDGVWVFCPEPEPPAYSIVQLVDGFVVVDDAAGCEPCSDPLPTRAAAQRLIDEWSKPEPVVTDGARAFARGVGELLPF
jgi:hypothetical protein